MKKLILLETLADGSIVEYPLQTLQTIIARQGAGYAVIDKESGKPPRDMTLKREGDALAVQVSGETVVQLDAFYEEGASAAYTVDGADTSAEAVLITSSQGQTAENGEIIWQSETAEDDGGVSPWAWGGALAGAGVAALAAGGGGGGSETDTSIPSYTLTVTAAAGPFTSDATVEVYDRNGTLLTTGAIDPETGRVAFTITNAYSGPLMVKVIDANGAAGDYLDEATNTATSLGEPLRAFIMADGSSDIRLTVSPLTELAVRKAGIDEANLSLSADDVAVNDQVAELFGVDDITGDVATVLDDAYDAGDGLSAAETYGNVLAMLSGADGNTGSMDATLDQLESLIHTTGEGDLAFSQEAVDLLSDGIETFENGVNGGEADLNESIIEPPVIPSAENGLNRAEKTGGVAVKLDGAAAGDAVTILWGDQSHTHSVQAGDIDADGLVTITVPESVVDGAGDGDIQVRSQINGGDANPAVIIHMDTTDPTITSGATATALDENSGAGQVIYTVTSDAGDGVTYSLKAVDDYTRLSINGTTGQVTLTGDPDYETQSSYSFTVVATDAAGNATEQAVTLNINDVDDTPPVILDVSIPNSAMNVGDTVTATITVQDDGGDIYTNLSGTIGGFSLSNLTRIDSTTYTARFTVTQGGTVVAAGSDIPVNLTIDDTSGNTSIAYTTAVIQAGDSIDANGPTISSIAITGATGIQNSTLNAGDVVSITVTMDEATTVTGTPQLALDIGGATVQANYAGGSGTTALFFTYTITNETDADGISIDTDSLSLNGGTLTDAAGNAAMITHDAVADNAGYMVDTAAPTLSTATPADDATGVAPDSSITMTFDEDIALGSSGTITVSDGSDTHTIDVADHSGRLSISGNTLTINPTADLANNGSTYHLEIDSGAITDTAGNAYAGIDDETTLNFDTVPGVDTTIVVFDLTTGMSSSHSGRTFQADVAYDIYIVVDADSAALSSLDAAEQWSGADALDSDSTIILCGNGDAAGVLGFCGEAVDDYSMTASYIVWMTPSTTNAGAAGLFSTGSFVRCTIGSTSITRLWTGNWAANPDAGQGISAIYTAQMPVGIMTTQVFT